MKNLFRKCSLSAKLRKAVSLLLVVTLLTGVIPQEVYASGSANTGSTQSNRVMEYEGDGYQIKAEMTASWGQYANLDVTISNKSLHKMTDWELQLPNEFVWNNIWNAQIERVEDDYVVIKGADWNQDVGILGSVNFGGTVYCEDGVVCLPESIVLTDLAKREEAEESSSDKVGDAGGEAVNQGEESVKEADNSESDVENTDEETTNHDSDTKNDVTTSRLPYEVPEELKGLNYAVFSGNRNGIAVCSNETRVCGDVYSNGRFAYSGTKLYVSGGLHAAGSIQTSTSGISDALYIGSKVENMEAVSMPDLTGLLDEKLRPENQEIQKNITLNSDEMYMTDALVAEENVEISGTSFIGEGILYAGRNIIYNVGSMTTASDAELLLCAKEGNITLNGSTFELNGVLYAPNGCVIINANEVTLNGRIIADTVCLNGTYFNINAGEHDFDMIREWIEEGEEDLNEETDKPLQAELSVSGNSKQYRKVVIDVKNSGEAEFTDEINATWSITKSGIEEETQEQNGIFAQNGCLLVDDTVSTKLHKELLFKEAGTYTVSICLQQNGGTIQLEKELVIEKDRAPEAGFALTQDFFVRGEKGTATISVNDISLSHDGDEIGQRTWQIVYDKNNDGIFDEEPELISDGNEEKITYQTKKAGKYKVLLTVREHFEDTIDKFITKECYQTDDTSDVTESACIVSVLNEAPEVSFDIEKVKKADIIFTSGSTSKEDVQYCNEQIAAIKKELEAQGVDVRTTTVETSTLTAKDSFAWKEYDHYNRTGKWGTVSEHHITYDENIRFTGYKQEPYKDFLYISDNNSNIKILQFDLQRDKKNWHTMEGGGFLFNTEINEEKDLINGFSVLLSSTGIKIMQMDNIPLSKFRDGEEPYATCIASVKMDDVYDKKNFRVQVDKRTISVWCNDEVVIENFVLPECTSYGYGPILSNAYHNCNQISYFDFENITMSTVVGEQLNDVINDYDWREGAQKYVIHLSDVKIPELSMDETLANTIKAVMENDINLLVVGSDKTEEQTKKLINTTDKGMWMSYEDLSGSMQTIREYICSDIEKATAKASDFYSVDDILSYKVNYKDKEKDSLYKSEWTYEGMLLSSDDMSQKDIITETSNSPIEKFSKTGAYTVRLRAQDNPETEDLTNESETSANGVSQNTISENTISENTVSQKEAVTDNYYGEWSEFYEYPELLLVQTLPQAEIETSIAKDVRDSKKCAVYVTTSAFDADHVKEDGQGIIAESLQYKEVNEDAWTEGVPAYSLPIGGVYLIKYQVQDKEKSYSYPRINIVNTNDIREFEPYEDKTKPEISFYVSKEEISLGDSVKISAFVQDENPLSTFSVYFENDLLGNNQGSYTYTPTRTGNFYAKVEARDIAGNTTTEKILLKVVDKDINAPYIQVDSISRQVMDADYLVMNGTIQDDKALKGYTISCRRMEEEYTEIYSSVNAVSDNTIARIDVSDWEDGEYELLIAAEDEAGNQSFYSSYCSLSTKTIEGERRIWIDEILLNQEKDQIEVYGTLIKKDETETVSSNCIRTEDNTTVSMNGTEAENGLLAVIPTEGLQTGHYEISFVLMTQDGDFTKVTQSFSYTCNSEEKNDALVVETEKDLVDEEKTSIILQLSKTKAETGTDIIARIYKSGSISENSIRLSVSGNEIPLTNGKATITSDTPCQMTVCAEAYTKDGQYLSVSKNCIFVNKTDKTAPEVSFKGADEEGNLYLVLKEPTKLVGSVSDETKLLSYRLEYRMQDWEDYVLLAQGNEEKHEEALATLDTTLLMNGVYEVRLTAVDAGGNESSAVCVCTVEGNLKVGEMAVGFTDLTTTMPFGNLNINRMYDSRNLTQGDFGYGWSLGLAGMTIQKTKELEKGYKQVRSGSGLSTIYRLEELYPHDVIVSHGDGTSDRFHIELSPKSRRWLAIEEVKVSFTCVTNPKLKLELAGDNAALVNGDELVWIFDDAKRDNYILTLEDETKVYLSGEKGITKTVDATGNTMTYSKNGFTDENGKGVAFERDRQGRIKQISDDYGHTRSYTYDEDGNLSTYTDQAGNTVTYTYDDAHRLVQIIDPGGIAVSRYEYDETGRLVAVIDAEGNRIAYNHDTKNRREVVTDRRGYATIYEYDTNGNVTSTTDANGNTTKATYDENGNVLTETDALGNTKTYAYDEKGNLTTTTDEAGNVSNAAYDSKNQITGFKNMDGTELLIDYNEKGLLTATQDTDGNKTEYTYDAYGNISGITDELGEVEAYTYDANGNLTKTTDGEGNITYHTYDENGNRIQTRQNKETPYGITTVKTSYKYDDAGRVIQTNSSSGNVTKTTYNENGNIASTTDAEGKVTTYTHTPDGEVETITYHDGTTEHFTYDEEGNVLTQTDRLGNTVTNTYDKVGNLLTETDVLGNKTTYEYDAAYHLTRVTGPTGVVTEYTYDTLGRNTEIKTAEGTVSYSYDAYGNVTAMTDVTGNTTRYEYDSLGRRCAVCLPDGTRLETEYDVRGNITSQTDAEGNKTAYEYDNINNLTGITNGEGETTLYHYNGAGELLSTTDANGNKTTYEYNADGDITKEIRADGNYRMYTYNKGRNPYIVYDYDKTQQINGYRNYRLSQTYTGEGYIYYTYNENNQLETVYDSEGTIRYGYDSYGRITSRQTATGEEIQYGYDTYGRLNELTTSEGTTRYEYDNYDRLTSVEDKNGNQTTYTYDKNGNRETQTNPDGSKTTYTYDVCNRLESEETKDQNGNLLSGYHYTYNGNGQKIQAEETVRAPGAGMVSTKTAYEYDKANRLTGETVRVTKNGETETTSTAYTYDDAGNRIRKLENGVLTEYTYNELNQLVSETTQGKVINYAYDTNGNLLCKGTQTEYDTYTYTTQNQLASVTNHTATGETTESYVYDAEGNRLKKTAVKKKYVVEEEKDAETTAETISETTTYYVMDTVTGYAQVLMELDENKQAKVLYTRGDGLVSREQIQTNGETKTSFYLSDGHGDVRQLTDESGSVTDAYRYNSFGELKESTGNTDNPYLYTGEYYDEGTGLYYLRARYMNPETGTFISMDTYRGNSYDPASLHRYTYAQNNPQIYNDPSGHFAAISFCLNQASQAVMRNLHTIHIAGMVTAAVSGIVNSVINPKKDLGLSLLEGYAAGAGIAMAVIGISAIVVTAGVMAVIDVMMFSAQVMAAAYNIILALAYGVTGNNKAALTHLSIAVILIIEIYVEFGMSGSVTASGSKGEVTVEVESGSNTGKLTIIDGDYSASEINAAQYMTDLGNDVVLRPPVGTRAGGQTSDLLVNGINYDVYTPTTNNPSAIIRAITKKNTQTTGVVLDLSSTTVTADDLGNILARIKGAIEKNGGTCNINDIIIMPK